MTNRLEHIHVTLTLRIINQPENEVDQDSWKHNELGMCRYLTCFIQKNRKNVCDYNKHGWGRGVELAMGFGWGPYIFTVKYVNFKDFTVPSLTRYAQTLQWSLKWRQFLPTGHILRCLHEYKMYTKRPFEQSTGSRVTINELKQLYTCMLPYFLVCNSFILNLSYYNIFQKLLKMKI